MLDLKAEPGVEFARKPLAMAVGGIALVAQQAECLTRSCCRVLGERGQFVKLVFRLRRGEVPLEDAQHRIGLAAARREAALLRRSELLQMQIADAVRGETGGELAFGEPGPSRRCDRAHVDRGADLGGDKRIEECRRSRMLIADGEKRCHDLSFSISAIAAAGARTLPSWMKYTKISCGLCLDFAPAMGRRSVGAPLASQVSMRLAQSAMALSWY